MSIIKIFKTTYCSTSHIFQKGPGNVVGHIKHPRTEIKTSRLLGKSNIPGHFLVKVGNKQFLKYFYLLNTKMLVTKAEIAIFSEKMTSQEMTSLQ
jgi:hypothetical protein